MLLERCRAETIPGLPPFQGGVAGYIAYDFGAVLERLPAPRYDDLALPDCHAGSLRLGHRLGPSTRRGWLVSTGIPVDRAPARAAARRRAAGVGANGLLDGPAAGAAGRALQTHQPEIHRRLPIRFPVTGTEHAAEIGLRSSFTHRGYLDAVTRVREYIVAGDIFQANLSQRLEAPLEEDPWHLYRRLREVNPAPFAAYLEFDGVYRGQRVAGAIPSGWIRRAASRPVRSRAPGPAGSSPRHDAGALPIAPGEREGSSREPDDRGPAAERSVARAAGPAPCACRSCSRSSAIGPCTTWSRPSSASWRRDRTPIDLLRGSVPGWLDHRRAEGARHGDHRRAGAVPAGRLLRLDRLSERHRRDGHEHRHPHAAWRGRAGSTFSAGGGIVADSDPEAEYQETLDKARALITALAGAVTTP